MATALAQSLAQEVPQSIIENALNHIIAGDLSEISAQLCTARQAFKRFPELVTAAELPAHLIPFITEGQSDGIKPDEFIAAEKLEEMRARAPELAAHWYTRRVGGGVDPEEDLTIDKDDTGIALEEHAEAVRYARMPDFYDNEISHHSVKMLRSDLAGTPITIGGLCDLISRLEGIRDVELGLAKTDA